jgi:hypothetical protein
LAANGLEMAALSSQNTSICITRQKVFAQARPYAERAKEVVVCIFDTTEIYGIVIGYDPRVRSTRHPCATKDALRAGLARRISVSQYLMSILVSLPITRKEVIAHAHCAAMPLIFCAAPRIARPQITRIVKEDYEHLPCMARTL